MLEQIPQRVIDLAASRGGWTDETRWRSLADLCRSLPPGVLVECGVARGSSATILAWAAQELGRTLYLFDTFQGLPPAGDVDKALHPDHDFDKHIGGCRGELDDVSRFLSAEFPGAVIRYSQGRFEETLPLFADLHVALLHADGDWYESTKTILTHLGPRVVRGGVVVLDDYGFWKGCQQATDEYLAELAPSPTLQRVGRMQAWFRTLREPQ